MLMGKFDMHITAITPSAVERRGIGEYRMAMAAAYKFAHPPHVHGIDVVGIPLFTHVNLDRADTILLDHGTGLYIFQKPFEQDRVTVLIDLAQIKEMNHGHEIIVSRMEEKARTKGKRKAIHATSLHAKRYDAAGIIDYSDYYKDYRDTIDQTLLGWTLFFTSLY
jgi:hypothetical protein